MSSEPRNLPKIDLVLYVLTVLALIGVVIDLIDGYWLKTISSVFLFVGLIASIQWRRYRSRRWRTLAWISFSVAVAALVFRFASYYGFVGS